MENATYTNKAKAIAYARKVNKFAFNTRNVVSYEIGTARRVYVVTPHNQVPKNSIIVFTG